MTILVSYREVHSARVYATTELKCDVTMKFKITDTVYGIWRHVLW
jgi:hypothetical protein